MHISRTDSNTEPQIIIQPKEDDDDKATKSTETVPMVQEESDGQLKKPDINTAKKPAVFNTANILNDIFDDFLLLKTKTDGDNDETTEDLIKGVVKALEIWTHSAQDDENYNTLNFSVPKGFHGNFSTNNKFEHDTTGNAFGTTDNIELTFGTKKTNTTASFSYEAGFIKENNGNDNPAVAGFNDMRAISYAQRYSDGTTDDTQAPIPIHNINIDPEKIMTEKLSTTEL